MWSGPHIKTPPFGFRVESSVRVERIVPVKT